MSASFELVTTPERLAEVAARLASAPAIAVDTEFVRRTTFYPRPGLLQLSAGDGEFLVDLVALPDPAPLRALFLAPAPLKVMHSCSEDLEVLKRLFGVLPGSLVDTQVAAERDHLDAPARARRTEGERQGRAGSNAHDRRTLGSCGDCG